MPAVEPYLQAWAPVLERHPDALLYPTTAAGARGVPVRQRWAHVEELARRGPAGMTLVDPGSVNVGLTADGADPAPARRVPPGAIVKLYFADDRQFGLPPTPVALEACLELLEPSGLPWSVAVLGGDVVGSGLAELAVRRGGHLRAGLEDFVDPAGTTPSNRDLIEGALRVLDTTGATPATPARARTMLGIW